MTTTATALQSPEQWLDSFFEQRKLRQPDGRRLYAYRLSPAEYESLRALLRRWASDDIVSMSGYLARGVAKTFVLYGAAWWQREYSGGHWRWEDVVNSFGASATSWHHALRSTCVTIGLESWKQRIRDQGMRYFGLLVEQGGLPSRQLAEARGNVATVTRILIRRAARLGVDIDYVAAQAGKLSDRLPRAIQNAESYSLIAQMVGTTLELKCEHKLSKGEDPVEKLDRLERRCKYCGSSGTEPNIDHSLHCAECGRAAPVDHIRKYLEPAGFAVDLYPDCRNGDRPFQPELPDVPLCRPIMRKATSTGWRTKTKGPHHGPAPTTGITVKEQN